MLFTSRGEFTMQPYEVSLVRSRETQLSLGSVAEVNEVVGAKETCGMSGLDHDSFTNQPADYGAGCRIIVEVEARNHAEARC